MYSYNRYTYLNLRTLFSIAFRLLIPRIFASHVYLTKLLQIILYIVFLAMVVLQFVALARSVLALDPSINSNM